MEVIRGHVLLANQRTDEAEDVFKQTIISSGNAPKTMLRIMVSLYDNRYVNASYHLFKKFFSYVDDNWNDGYAYMALCCYDLEKYDEFMKYLRIGITKNPKETKLVLGQLFPKDMQVEEYESYIQELLNKK